jgi:hypothetical protein
MAKAYKIGLFVLLLTSFPLFASAATISFSKPSSTLKVGNTFSVTVYVSSAQEAMNAASGTVSFSKDKIQVVSLQRSGSIFSFWAQEPAFSNSAGTVSFAGIVPSPGYKGGGGKILTINFKAKATGAAKVSLSSGSVLANDGNGTNIYTGAGSTNFTIAAADPASTPTTKPEEPTTPQEPVAQPETTPAPITETTTQIAAPIITFYPEQADFGTPIKIRGTSYPNSGITIRVKQQGQLVSEEKTVSNDSGEFLSVVSKSLEPGVYVFTAQVTDPAGQQSKESSDLAFTVIPQVPVDSSTQLINYAALAILGLLALIGLIATVIFLRQRIHMMILRHEEKTLAHSFSSMREHIDRYIANSKIAKNGRKLSPANILALQRLSKSSIAAEDIITKKNKKVAIKKKPIKKKLKNVSK